MSKDRYLEYLKDLDITEKEKLLVINQLIELSKQLLRSIMIKEEAVIYTRVSSAKQVTHGSGLQTQGSHAADMEENKIKVLKVFQMKEFRVEQLLDQALMS